MTNKTVKGGDGENKDLREFARLAKKYQTKRQRTAGINLASGLLGGLGAGLVLSGVGAPIGMALMGAAGVLKFGGSIFGTVRDKIFKGKAAAKKQKELDWARTAAKNYKDANIKNVLKAMGAESIALDEDALDEMTEEERVQVMLQQLMKR